MAYLSGWTYRRKFTSDNTKVSDSYPYAMVLDLSALSGTDFFSKIKSGGEDIRITKSDGTTELARGVREIDTSGKTGLVYLLATDISTSEDTDYYLYYGNSSASDYADDNALGMEGVFSSNHLAYYTLADVKDETDSDFNLTNVNTVTFDSAVLGDGADSGTSNTDKRLNIDNDLGVSGGNFTFGGFFKIRTAPSDETYTMAWQADAGNDVGFGIRYIDSSGTKTVSIFRGKGGVGNEGVDEETDLGTSSFHHLLLTYDGTDVEAYIDGSSVGTASASGNGTGGYADDFSLLSRGDNNYGPASSIVDEFMVLDTPLTANQITTIYNNQSDNSNFWTIASEEQILSNSNFFQFF